MSDEQLEAKAIIEKALNWCVKLALPKHAMNFLEIWAHISGRPRVDNGILFEWMDTLNKTSEMIRLRELLLLNNFSKLGIESIFMGEIVYDNK